MSTALELIGAKMLF